MDRGEGFVSFYCSRGRIARDSMPKVEIIMNEIHHPIVVSDNFCCDSTNTIVRIVAMLVITTDKRGNRELDPCPYEFRCIAKFDRCNEKLRIKINQDTWVVEGLDRRTKEPTQVSDTCGNADKCALVAVVAELADRSGRLRFIREIKGRIEDLQEIKDE